MLDGGGVCDDLLLPGNRGCVSGDVSFIVPAFNAATTLRASVASIRASAPGAELVIVDDGSLDDTRALAEELADVMVSRPCQAGAARARNDACRRASGSVYFFVDADVTVNPAAVSGLIAHIEEGADAAFGAYGPWAPDAVRNAATDYKNLLHHFTHLQGATSRARTFWSGFGVITCAAFEAVGGFDPAVTRSADVEDIHLGYRLEAAGYRIVLDPRWQVCHHKRYTPLGLVRSDLFHRAIPWTRAMVELRPSGLDLTLEQHSILSSSALWLALAASTATVAVPLALSIAAPAALAWLWWNRRFLACASHRLGRVGALRCAGFLAAFHLYAPMGGALGLAFAVLRRPNRSIRNSLSLDLLGERLPSALELSVAVIADPTSGLAALDHLPDPSPWWELVVVATEEPSALPPGASYFQAPPGARPNGLR
ncbi:MAG: glycosyltransferase, partial [Actinomycetota bacterium]|nr:glycosyltransferase [Actinomycetota bacterium]